MPNKFHNIHRLEITTSTNDEAIRRARAGAPEGEVFVTQVQTMGRGRQGRRWETPAGKSLSFSLLLRPPTPVSEISRLTLVAGAAVHEALASLVDPALARELKIKWPNDVYLQGKKIAGLLTETETLNGKIPWVVIGIGINVNTEEAEFSPEVRRIATSLKLALGRSFDREEILQLFLRAFEKRYFEFCGQGFTATQNYVHDQGYLNGKHVHAAEGSLTFTGTVTGLSEEGYLLLRTDSGQIVSILVGDVQISK